MPDNKIIIIVKVIYVSNVLFIGSQIYTLDSGILSYYAPNLPKKTK